MVTTYPWADPLLAREQRAALEDQPTHATLAGALRAAGEALPNIGERQGLLLLDTHGNEQHLSYPELWQQALVAAAGLRALGVRPQDRVVIMLPTSAAYLVTVCAAIAVGAVPCTMAQPASRAKSDDARGQLGAVAAKLQPRLIVVPETLRDVLQDDAALARYPLRTPDELLGGAPLELDTLPTVRPEDPLHIQLTSGSTSVPKGVLLTHQQAVANIKAITQAVGYAPREEPTLVWLPLYHDMGFVQCLINIFYQSQLVLMTPFSFLRQPLSWLRNISTYGVAMSAAPTFAYQACVQKFDPQKLDGLDLSRWRRAFVGAEPVHRTILEDFTRCYAPYGLQPQTIYPCYGMAETVLATSLHQRPPASATGFLIADRISEEAARRDNQAVPCADDAAALEVLSMGQAVPGLEISVQDAEGRQLDDRVIGEICVRGTSLTAGYFNDAGATEAAIREGWYHTGDRGYLVDGDLYVLGRIKELLIVRGRNYLPYDIETMLESHLAIRKGYSVVFGIYNSEQGTDDVVAIVETKAEPSEQSAIIQDLQQSLQSVFGFRAREIVCVRHGVVPRTTSGKRQRALSRELYQSGTFHRADAPGAE